jgi:dipeptidyl aminopeptidase/acylaminoacyl peptidase
MKLVHRSLVQIILCLCLSASAVVWGQSNRVLTLDDIFKSAKIPSYLAVAPEGDAFAFLRKGPQISPSGQPHVGGGLQDIWVATFANGRATKITNSDSDNSDYWYSPVSLARIWSPDGKRLAIYSTKGGSSSLSVLETATRRVTRLIERPLVLSFAWLDNTHLLASRLPESAAIYGGPENVAMREWLRQKEGRTATVSVLESGVRDDSMKRPQAQQQAELLSIDVVSGAVRTLDRAPSFADIYIAPDGQHFAFLKAVSVNMAKLPLEDAVAGWKSSYLYELVVSDAQGRIVFAEKNPVTFILPDSFQWSSDGSDFAFLGRTADEKSFHVFLGTVSGTISECSLPNTTGGQKLTSASGDRFLVAAEQESHTGGKATSRLDWWMVSPTAAPRNLTENLASVPSSLLPISDGKALVGIVDGDLWRFDIESGIWASLTASFEPKVDKIVWPLTENARHGAPPVIVVAVPRGEVTDYYRVDVQSASITQLKRPSDSAELVAYSAEMDTAVFRTTDSSGTSLTTVRRDTVRSVAQTNQFLREIVPGKCRSIAYRSVDGKNLKGWILLPPKYETGKRYPLVAWVYAGLEYGGKEPDDCHLQTDVDTLQLLAARGYAVLFPSMPLPPAPSDPYAELTKGVLPAVDKAIELGIADPARLAVFGHSFGGYSTMGLIEQTNRFRAAIEFSGISDLTSYYGSYRVGLRYDPHAHEIHGNSSWMEVGNGRMGGPPWKDADRYVRNSPISFADRVQTPLLIIQGDNDFVSITQGEEFFNALYRQGKRARFARYWGEGHGLISPANIRDYWQQVYAWLDEFCDVSRDNIGNLIFDGDRVKSRNGAPALKPEDFARFDEIELKSRPEVQKTVGNH